MTPEQIGIPEMLGVRLEPKLRYLAELAARVRPVRQSTLTAYVEWALTESFKNVTLRKPEAPEPIYDGQNATVPGV